MGSFKSAVLLHRIEIKVCSTAGACCWAFSGLNIYIHAYPRVPR